MPFSVRSRIASFRYAFRGTATLVRTQHNAWLHIGATAGVVILGLALGLGRSDWIAIILALGLVWTAEALNTAVEFLADEVSLEKRHLIGNAKDVGAAAVLFSSVSALAVGIFVFVPYIRVYFLRSNG